MPLPKPNQNESGSEFIARCINNAEIQLEFPNVDQRIAVCTALFDNKKKQKSQNLNIDKWRDDHERQRQIVEKKYISKLSRYYYSQYKKGIDSLLNNGFINDLELFRYDAMQNLMVDMYVGIGMHFAKWYFNNHTSYLKKARLGTKIGDYIPIWEQIFQNYAIQYSAKQISLVQGTALKQLKSLTRALLNDPEIQGLGIKQKARILNNRFKSIAEWQSKRIVRTETTTAANYATEQSALTMFPPEQLEKTWITSLDGREREWHGAVNGQVVNANEKFLVGGEYLNRAGEGNGANRINCRCSVAYTPKPDPMTL